MLSSYKPPTRLTLPALDDDGSQLSQETLGACGGQEDMVYE
jgi:hypothetical protein